MSFPGMLGSFQIVNMGSLCQFFIGFGKYQIALDRGMQTGNQISLMCPVAGTSENKRKIISLIVRAGEQKIYCIYEKIIL